MDRRERRPNVRLDQDAVNREKMLKLQRSRSGHQRHLTELNNKISVLLFDVKNEDAVKELVKLSSWEICLSMRQISLRERVEIA